MKSLALKLLFLFPFPLVIILLNLWSDPAHLFNIFDKVSYEEGIVKHLEKGYNVTGVSANYNERNFQRYFIKSLDQSPDIVVIGSSRIMNISQDNFKDQTLINNGMSGATIEDDLAVIQLYAAKKKLPKKIIIGLDPYLLNENNGQTRWRNLENEYSDIAQKLSFNDEAKNEIKIPERYEQLFSISYFRASIENIFKKNMYSPVKTIENEKFTRLYDGSISYGQSYRNQTVEQVNTKALNIIKTKNINFCASFKSLSEKNKSKLVKAIKYLKANKVEIEFFLAPFHPIVYQYFKSNQNYYNVFKSESYYIELARSQNIKIIGSFNPSLLKLNSSSFYDEFHCSEKAISQIINKSTQL